MYIEERQYEDDTGAFDRLLLVGENIWGPRYIDGLIARRVERGTSGGGYTPPNGSWGWEDLSLTLTDSMYSVRRIIGGDWGSTSFSTWVRERAQLEIDYTAYGEPDAVLGLVTDPWVDFDVDGDVDSDDYTNGFSPHFSAHDPEADRNVDGVWDFSDVQLYLADTSAAGATLTPTGRAGEEENPFGLDGYRYDAITGLYHVRNRVLDPEQGKWLQRDPAGFVDGGNVYSFALSRPLTNLDQTGLDSFDAMMGAYIPNSIGVGIAGQTKTWFKGPFVGDWWVSTDGRSAGTLGSSRLRSEFSISTDDIGSHGRVTALTYDDPFRIYNKTTGELKVKTATPSSSTTTLNYTYPDGHPALSRSGPACQTTIRVRASATFPFKAFGIVPTGLSPDIDYTFNWTFVTYEDHPDTLDVRVIGRHNQFPNYEAWTGTRTGPGTPGNTQQGPPVPVGYSRNIYNFISPYTGPGFVSLGAPVVRHTGWKTYNVSTKCCTQN